VGSNSLPIGKEEIGTVDRHLAVVTENSNSARPENGVDGPWVFTERDQKIDCVRVKRQDSG